MKCFKFKKKKKLALIVKKRNSLNSLMIIKEMKQSFKSFHKKNNRPRGLYQIFYQTFKS